MRATLIDRRITRSFDDAMRRVELRIDTDFGTFIVSLDGPAEFEDAGLTVREVRPWQQLWLLGITFAQRKFLGEQAVKLASAPIRGSA